MRFLLLILLIAVQANSQGLKVGDKFEGGIVFYATKKHGLVVAEKSLGAMSWDTGRKVCDTLTLTGYTDWRLPSRNEIAIIYYALFVEGLIKLPSGVYWTKSENKGITDLAWWFDFGDGSENNNHSKSNEHNILAVRSY